MLDNRNGTILTPDPPMAPITDADLPDRPTVAEVARWLRKSKATIYNWIREGAIPCKRVRKGSYLFDKAVLIEWAGREEAA